jgi:hypothetical protein
MVWFWIRNSNTHYINWKQIETPVLIGFLKASGIQNTLPTSFGTEYYPPPSHTNF